MNDDELTRYRQAAESAARGQREIQSVMERRDRERAKQEKGNGKKDDRAPEPVQAGDRPQPGFPLPEQHLRKPGMESDLEPRPRYMAPGYKGSGKKLRRRTSFSRRR